MKSQVTLETTRLANGGRRRQDMVLAVWPGGASSVPVRGRDSILIGRGDDCTLRINHPSASRRHAALTIDDNGWEIKDLGSQNGTWFGEQRLEKGRSARGSSGTTVRLGDALLFVQRAVGGSRRRGRAADSGDLCRELALIAACDIPVLLLGESGVGKNRLAQKIHAASLRHAAPFVSVRCSSEAELFGGDPLAPFRESNGGGTLLLDEVGDLSVAAQAELLSRLEWVTQNGPSNNATGNAVRIVATCHLDLESLVARGTFRADLYHRLAGYTFIVPPLRERSEEVASLAIEFAERASLRRGAPMATLSAEALSALKKYPWPGNVRELQHVVDCAVALSVDGILRPDVLPPRVTSPRVRPSVAPTVLPGRDAHDSSPAMLRGEIEAIERRRILEALERCAGNQTRAAKLLGIGRRTLLKRLDEYQLIRPRRRAE
jgi:two-component system response regulator AtoC